MRTPCRRWLPLWWRPLLLRLPQLQQPGSAAQEEQVIGGEEMHWLKRAMSHGPREANIYCQTQDEAASAYLIMTGWRACRGATTGCPSCNIMQQGGR